MQPICLAALEIYFITKKIIYPMGFFFLISILVPIAVYMDFFFFFFLYNFWISFNLKYIKVKFYE